MPEPSSGGVDWFVCQSWPQFGAEKKAISDIRRLGFQVLQPLQEELRVVWKGGHAVRRNGVRVSEPVLLPLWPGYFFVRFHRADPWGEILRVEGVSRIVSSAAGGLPSAVNRLFVEDLIRRSDERGLIRGWCEAEEVKLLEAGTQGKIKHLLGGALDDVAATVLRDNGVKILVIAAVFGGARTEIDRADFQAAG